MRRTLTAGLSTLAMLAGLAGLSGLAAPAALAAPVGPAPNGVEDCDADRLCLWTGWDYENDLYQYADSTDEVLGTAKGSAANTTDVAWVLVEAYDFVIVWSCITPGREVPHMEGFIGGKAIFSVERLPTADCGVYPEL